MTKALVLGGGGITGIAWELGVLCALQRAGVPLGGADIIIGTSAGSVVGAGLAAGVDLETAVAQQQAPAPARPARDVDMTRVFAVFSLLADRSVPPQQARAEVGALALEAPTGDEASYIAGIARGLPSRDWPQADLRITAVDTADGRDVVFDAASGVPLDLAVAASCAVPAVFPPVTIDGRRYMDGGVRSGTNADLATGADQLVVIAPMSANVRAKIHAEIAATGAGKTLLIEPDEAALEAFGPNVLDPARRADAVAAGLRQGGELPDAVRAVWPG